MALDIEYKDSSGNWHAMPSPTAINRKKEQIWSSNTGRNTSGEMKGEVVAVKRTFDVQWGVLTSSEYSTIESNLKSGFQQLKICGDVFDVYHGTLEAEYAGVFGNTTYYRSAKTELIER